MSNQATLARPVGFGTVASAALLAVYFGALTLISSWRFTLDQLNDFWFYIVPLAAGFGVQVALYLLFNFAGIAYVANKLVKATRQHEQCLA